MNNLAQSLGLLFYRWNDVKGRSNLPEFWYPFVFFTILITILLFISEKLSLAASLIFIAPMISLIIRRFHDIGQVGWWILSPIITVFILGISYVLYLQTHATPEEALAATSATLSVSILLIGVGVWVINLYLLSRKGHDQSNQFGPPSDYMSRKIEWDK